MSRGGSETLKELELCDSLVERARKMGADDAEVFYVKSRTLGAVFQKNDLQVPKGDDYEGLGIRVLLHGNGAAKQGFAATNMLSSDSLEDTLRAAITIAKASPEDPNHWMPEPSQVEPVPGRYDKSVESMRLEDAVEQGLKLVESARSFDSRVMMDTAHYMVEVTEKAIANSKGIRLTEQDSVFTCIAFGFARDGEEVSPFDAGIAITCNKDAIAAEATGLKLARKVVSSLGATTVPSFKGDVIITPYAAYDLIAEPVSFACNAQNVQNGRSKWAGQLGAQVMSPLISITDDPRIPGAAGSTSFDREGVPPATLQLVSEGTLNHYLYNCYAARKDGIASNGRASGSDHTVPGISTTNFVVASGKRSVHDMIAGCSKGLLVNRFSGNVDSVSGDFSGVVKGGHYIEAGKTVCPVKEVMISGNIYELLKQVVDVSREYVDVGGSGMPYIQIEGCAIAGK